MQYKAYPKMFCFQNTRKRQLGQGTSQQCYLSQSLSTSQVCTQDTHSLQQDSVAIQSTWNTNTKKVTTWSLTLKPAIISPVQIHGSKYLTIVVDVTQKLMRLHNSIRVCVRREVYCEYSSLKNSVDSISENCTYKLDEPV